ncbi:hypothetical protein D9619_008798 [Psilocybe cf. subviscida]|uniref:Uncharacterized protein n=1 Tax=Psilocybe cf. subviscida TaxID=2480587 RepID=A0A8H5F0K0_9AGAR|nr:hypothetical protein D9619_008798 [Psilocybe cf. subviscida]
MLRYKKLSTNLRNFPEDGADHHRLLIPAYVYDSSELKFAKYPVVAGLFVFNRSVGIACLVEAFNFHRLHRQAVVAALTQVLLADADGRVHHVWHPRRVLMRLVHRSQPILIAGLAIRALGCGLVCHSRGANASDVEVVFSEIIQGVSGGFAPVSLKVSAQAAVPHADIAVVTSLALLITEIGGAISTAICRHLVRHDALSPRASPPFLSDADRALLYSSIYGAAQFTCGHPVRESVFLAYDDVMKIVAIVATVFGALPQLLDAELVAGRSAECCG